MRGRLKAAKAADGTWRGSRTWVQDTPQPDTSDSDPHNAPVADVLAGGSGAGSEVRGSLFGRARCEVE